MHISRRQWLLSALMGPVLRPQSIAAQDRADNPNSLKRHTWVRDLRNPIFAPQSPFDKRGSQGPFVVPHNGRWWMFYAGIGIDGVQRICLSRQFR